MSKIKDGILMQVFANNKYSTAQRAYGGILVKCAQIFIKVSWLFKP